MRERGNRSRRTVNSFNSAIAQITQLFVLIYGMTMKKHGINVTSDKRYQLDCSNFLKKVTSPF